MYLSITLTFIWFFIIGTFLYYNTYTYTAPEVRRGKANVVESRHDYNHNISLNELTIEPTVKQTDNATFLDEDNETDNDKYDDPDIISYIKFNPVENGYLLHEYYDKLLQLYPGDSLNRLTEFKKYLLEDKSTEDEDKYVNPNDPFELALEEKQAYMDEGKQREYEMMMKNRRVEEREDFNLEEEEDNEKKDEENSNIVDSFQSNGKILNELFNKVSS